MAHVIAIDGPSGVGKSSVARELAARMGWTYLDTGAMYRTVTLAWLRSKAGPEALDDHNWLSSLDMDFNEERILLDGCLVNKEIRTQDVTAKVSQVAAAPAVRSFLTEMQRKIAGLRNCILDGRDIGTVVFPQAFLKIYLVATGEVRARRRWLQIGGARSGRTLDEIYQDQARRDHEDATRKVAPLKPANDAFKLNTDNLEQTQVVASIYTEATRRLEEVSA